MRAWRRIGRMTRLALCAAVALAACKSSAPYTLPAAALNTGAGAGAAMSKRASGGCYAVCTNETVCNPRTGLCERASAASPVASPAEYCKGESAASKGCKQIGISLEQPPPPAAPAPPIGVSPATGTVPPPPNEASPRRP